MDIHEKIALVAARKGFIRLRIGQVVPKGGWSISLKRNNGEEVKQFLAYSYVEAENLAREYLTSLPDSNELN